MLHFRITHCVLHCPGERKRKLTLKDSRSQEGRGRNPPSVEKPRASKMNTASAPLTARETCCGADVEPPMRSAMFQQETSNNVTSNVDHGSNSSASLLNLTTEADKAEGTVPILQVWRLRF